MARLPIPLILASLLAATLPGKAEPSRATLPARWRAGLEARLTDGDFLFREGTGPEAAAVKAAEAGGRLSHVGMAFRESGQWLVLHADPAAGVVAVPLDRFLAPDQASGYALYRHPGMGPKVGLAKVAALAEVAAHTPFDDDFDFAEHRRLYCTEYAWKVLDRAGLNPRAPITTVALPLAPMQVMLPSDLIEGAGLVRVEAGT